MKKLKKSLLLTTIITSTFLLNYSTLAMPKVIENVVVTEEPVYSTQPIIEIGCNTHFKSNFKNTSHNTLEVTPQIINNHFYVPLSFLDVLFPQNTSDTKFSETFKPYEFCDGESIIVTMPDSDLILEYKPTGESCTYRMSAKLIADGESKIVMVPIASLLKAIPKYKNYDIKWHPELKYITITCDVMYSNYTVVQDQEAKYYHE